MITNSAATSFNRRNALLAIVAGGLSAGIIDLAQALILFGAKVPLGIAGGLLGRQAAHGGGVSIYALGVFLHFFIAFSAATVYYVASRKLGILKGAPADLRPSLWRRGRSSDGANRFATLSAPRLGSIQMA